MDPSIKQQLLEQQTECTFVWNTRDGNSTGAIMAYLWQDDRFWLVATSGSRRVRALEKNAACTVVVSSAGTDLGPFRAVTVRGECKLHYDADTRNKIIPPYSEKLFPDNSQTRQVMEQMLNSPSQVVLEMIPGKWIDYDGQRMMSGM